MNEVPHEAFKSWIREIETLGSDTTELPEPGLIWSKAQSRRRLGAAEGALRPIRLTERLALWLAGAAVAGLIMIAWPQMNRVLEIFIHREAFLTAITSLAAIVTALFLLREVNSLE